MPDLYRWTEVRCSLFTAEDGPRMPWTALAAAIVEWQDEGRIDRWFFTRKPPGLRLRLLAREPAITLQPALVAWLEHAERSDEIRGWRLAVYEPEVFRFGGPDGIELAHEHFERDSRVALRRALVAPLGAPFTVEELLPRPLLSAIALDALVRRSVDDGAEAWDVWKRLEQIVQSTGVQAPALAPAGLWAALTDVTAFTAALPPEAADLLTQVLGDAEQVAAGLRAAHTAGALSVGPRAWLTAAAPFHWNRLGLTPVEMATVVARVLGRIEGAS